MKSKTFRRISSGLLSLLLVLQVLVQPVMAVQNTNDLPSETKTEEKLEEHSSETIISPAVKKKLSPLELNYVNRLEDDSFAFLRGPFVMSSEEDFNIKDYTFVEKDEEGKVAIIKGEELKEFSNISELNKTIKEYREDYELYKEEKLQELEPVEALLKITYKEYDELSVPLVINDLENKYESTKNENLTLKRDEEELTKEIFVNSLKDLEELLLNFKGEEEVKDLDIIKVEKVYSGEEDENTITVEEVFKEVLEEAHEDENKVTSLNLDELDPGYKYIFTLSSKEVKHENKILTEITSLEKDQDEKEVEELGKTIIEEETETESNDATDATEATEETTDATEATEATEATDATEATEEPAENEETAPTENTDKDELEEEQSILKIENDTEEETGLEIADVSDLLLQRLGRSQGSFEDKKFKLSTTMKVIASAKNPMPKGWFFDVDLGPYLKEDPANSIAPLRDNTGKVIATGSYDPQTHKIRYTITEKLTSSVELPIDQILAFDMNEIGEKDSIDINISVQPKNMAAQNMETITVSKENEADVIPSQPGFTSNIESPENVSNKVEYPVILEYHSHQTLRDKDGNEAVLGVVSNPQDLEVWWDIEVETDKLFSDDKNLDFSRLYFTLFASKKQGLKSGTYKIANNKQALNDTSRYTGIGDVGDLFVENKAINKDDLPHDKIYIRVKMKLKEGEYHSNYSLGLRVNPDRNYMEKIYKDFMDEYNAIPSIFKFIKGEGDAKKLANTPFNLVEDMFVAEFVHLGDPNVDENFYYDKTRTIVAEQDDDYSKRRWIAMDLLRIGETEDYSLANASLFPQPLKYTKYYYIPSITGGYSRTTNQNLATLSDGSYKPGVIVYYDYNVQSGTKDTNFKLDVNLKQKPVDNADVINKYDNIETQGGQQYLYSRKLEQNDDAYLAYLELPYLIMRINNTFEMVQCLNARRPDPTVNGNKAKVGLDRIENPTGAMLYSNIADYGDFKANDTYYDLLPGGKYNKNNQTKEDAAEDLFKRIYFFAEEIKREYPGNHNDTEMHRIIENQMLQRVIHYFTDGKDLSNDYAYVGTPTKDDGKYHHDITLTDPNLLNKDQYFKGDNRVNSDTDGHRKLSENEELDLENKGLKDVQVQYAQELLKRVKNSYNNDEWEKYSKAGTVTLVYFDHQSAKYQKLISGRVVDPITAYKVDSDGKKLEGAEFSFINRNTGEVIKAKATSNGMKVYLPEGSYRVRETKAPEGYELINPFNITVTNNEVNPDAGQYPAVGMRIKVHDGYKTEGKLSGVPQDIDGKDLVKKVDNKLEIQIVNISNKLGKLQFEKRDASKKLNGSEFRLTKIISKDNTNPEIGKDNNPVYQKTSTGNYGDFEFTEMPVGFYLLEETAVPNGYKKAKDQIIEVSHDQNGKAVTRFLDEKTEASKVIINEAKTIDIKLRKVDKDDENTKLQDAKFRIYSQRTIDNVLYFEERTSGADGIVNFDGLKEGEYILEELTAPSGYLLPKFLEGDKQFFGWKLFVKLDDKGELGYDIYKLNKREDAVKTEEQLNDSKINLDDVLKEGAVNIGNQIRTVDWSFTKYIENPKFDASQPESETNQKYIKLTNPDKLKQIKFNVYEADYYGKIINVNKPFLEDIQADENGVFHLKGLEFNGYYTLREMNTHGDYAKASDITLKIEAETIANEGEMKVIVRDPSNDVILGEQGILKSVINHNKGSKVGKFAIKKTGRSLWPQDNGKEVGLRRAFFRLYTAEDDFSIKLNAAGYPEKYIQKVTNGDALTDKDGKPTDPSTFPKDQGIAVFDNLKPGKYVLEEYRGPAGYEKDPRPIYVLVTEKGEVFKSRDKNDPIVNQKAEESTNTAQSFKDVTTPLRANATNNNGALTKEYTGTFAKIKIDAGAINTEKGTRHMKVIVAANREPIDFSLSYNYYVAASNWKASDLNGVYNASSSNVYYKYNIQPNIPFTVEFDAKLKDGTEEDVYKNILNRVRVFAKYNQRYEYYNGAVEDFKLIKKSNNFNAKVEFEYNYFDYEGIGEMNPQLIGTGTIWLETLENGKWEKVKGSEKQAYKDSQKADEFPVFEGLDKNKTYRIAYKLVDGYNLQHLWNWPSDTSYYNIDQSQADEKGNVLVKITNGNLLKIFNKDETGFRIPLRIEKANEDKSPLSGAKFRAKKIVDGEMVKGKDFYPKYHDEPFDAVTEATGLAGENYFRELTPGIYEMWEEEAPNEYTKLKSKWYFKVEVDPEKQPNEANYMRIEFNFSYRFPNDLSDKKYQHLTEAEKNRLRGKTIFGLNSNAETKFDDNRLTTDFYKEFIRNVKILPDNEISKPARPDAPYKGIDVVGVTNHKSLGKLEFKKVDLNNEAIQGAKFKLTKVRVESNGKLIIKSPDNRPDPVKGDDGKPVYQKEFTSKGILGVRFEGISEGTYLLEEVEAPKGYNKIKSYVVIRFRENEDGKIVEEVDRDQSDPDFLKHISFKNGSEIESITNEEKLTKLSFEKIDSKGNKVGTSSFNLQLVDDDGKVKKNDDGQIIYDRTLEKYDDLTKYEFTELKVGRYRLKEINHTIYAKPEAWFFDVNEDENGNLFIEFEKKEDQSIIKNIDGSYKVVNYAKTNFRFTKIGQGQDSPPVPLSNFYFSLKKVRTDKTEDGLQITYDENGNVTSMKDKSDNERIEKDEEGFIKNPEILEYSYYSKTKTRTDGSINFQDLTPGVYELEELTKHASYNENTQRRWIILVEPGDDKLVVSYDKIYEGNYYYNHDKNYYDNYYNPRNFKDSKFLTGNEDEGFNVINVRDKVDIKWRKVDSETGAIIHDMKSSGGQDGATNAIFSMFTLHQGAVSEDSKEFYDAWHVTGSSTRPPDIFTVDGTYAIYGIEPGVYAIPETQTPTGYKRKSQRTVIVLVTEKGKLKPEDSNYQPNSKELTYKLFEVKSEPRTSLDQQLKMELISDPSKFEVISVENGEIIFNDGFFDYKNEPDEKEGSFVIEKKDSKNRPLEGAVFELLDFQGKVIREAKSDENGKLVFAGLHPETYTLRESQPPIGYKQSNKVWKVFVYSNGHTFVREGNSEENPPADSDTNYERPSIEVKNEPIQETGEFTISKVDKANNNALPGATFKLEKTKDQEGNVLDSRITIGEKVSDEKGKIKFEKLQPGTYELTETNAPEDYKKVSDKWEITVDKDGNTTVVNTTANLVARSAQKFVNAINPAKITRAVGQEVPIEDIKVQNEKQNYGNFQIKKTDTDKTTALPGAEFTLVRVKDELGNKVKGEDPIIVTSGNEDGIAKFEKLKPGEYKLTETKAPLGYELLKEEYTVEVVDNNGKVSVKITKPGTTEESITSTETNSQESTLTFTSYDGWEYNEGKVIYKVSNTNILGEYNLDVEFTPTQNYNAKRVLNLIFDTDNFEVFYNGTELAANQANVSLYTHKNNGLQKVSFLLKAKYITKEQTLNPLLQFSWAGKVQYYLENNPEAYPKIELKKETTTTEGEALEKTGENSFEYNLVNNKINHKTKFLKVGKEVKDGKVSFKPLEDAVFRLEKKVTDKEGKVTFERIYRSFISDSEGNLVLDNLEAGEYKLYETIPPKDYRPIGIAVKEFIIDELGRTLVKNKDDQFVPLDESNKDIVNEKLGTESYEFTKRDGVTKEPLKDVEFELLNSNGDVVATVKSDEHGKVKFDKLQPGKYWIREKSQLSGYIKEKNLVKIVVGEQWKAPKYENPRNVSSFFSLDPLKQSTMTSTTGSETVVYPNVQEGLFAKLHYTINGEVKPGDKFVMAFSDNIDLDGLSTIGNREFDIYGPMGRIAEAKVREDRHTIDYTFTEALDFYNDLKELTINTQMFVNRLKVPYNQDDLEVSIKIQDPNGEKGNGAVFTDKINVNYDNETNNGYINAKENVKTYQLRLGTSSENPRKFKNVIYVNPVRANDGFKDIYFSANLPYSVDDVKVYKRTGQEKQHLPWSFKIDHKQDSSYGLEEITDPTWAISGGKVHIDLGDEYSKDEYVIEISGTVNEIGDFRTKTEYHRVSEYYNHTWYCCYSNGQVVDYWETWAKEYNPDAQADLVQDFSNYKNRIEYTKVTKGTEKPLEGVKFELRKLDGENKYTKVEGQDKTSGKDGKFYWEGLPAGKYQVWEIETPKGYVEPKNAVSSFEVNKDGHITNIKDNKTTIENEKEGMKFYLDKVWKEDKKSTSIKHGTLELKLTANDGGTFPEYVKAQEQIPEGAAYRIKEIAEDRKSITLEIDLSKAYEEVTISDGTKKKAIRIDVPADWPQGRYTLEETKAPAGYKKTEDTFSLNIDHKSNTIRYNEKVIYQKGQTNDGISILEIVNKKGIFPSTGGIGAAIFAIIGLGLMTVAFIGYRRKKVIE